MTAVLEQSVQTTIAGDVAAAFMDPQDRLPQHEGIARMDSGLIILACAEALRVHMGADGKVPSGIIEEVNDVATNCGVAHKDLGRIANVAVVTNYWSDMDLTNKGKVK